MSGTWSCGDCGRKGAAGSHEEGFRDFTVHECTRIRSSIMSSFPWSQENLQAQARLADAARAAGTCRTPYSDDWRAHADNCPDRALLYRSYPAGDRGAVTRWLSRPAETVAGAVTGVRAASPGACCCPPGGCRGHQDPLAAYWQVMAEPLGLGAEQLPAYGKAEPGCCRSCLRGPLYDDSRGPGIKLRLQPGSGLCIYCHGLAKMTAARRAELPGRRLVPRFADLVPGLIAAAVLIIVLSLIMAMR